MTRSFLADTPFMVAGFVRLNQVIDSFEVV